MLYLSFLMQTQRCIISVGHLLDSAILHIGLDIEFFPFVESLTAFKLNLSILLIIPCPALSKSKGHSHSSSCIASKLSCFVAGFYVEEGVEAEGDGLLDIKPFSTWLTIQGGQLNVDTLPSWMGWKCTSVTRLSWS